MFCRNCGSEVKDNAKFCSKCGANVERKNIDAKRINRQDGTTYNTFPQQPSQAPPQQPSMQYIPPQHSPNQSPAGGGGLKRPGGRSALIIILSIALVAGLCVNMFQFVNGTHILSRHSSQTSYYKTPDASLVSDTDEWGAVPLNQLIIVFDDDVRKSEAKKIIQQLGGVIVGEIEMINLYQIETEGRTETELSRLL
ncbi:MAG: zinc ribbon domain-containing protein, partial [Lentisphaerae bacterium]|nr:zinc ribbon domain-containing protein [Lentisphaerota bacterium]